MNSRWSRAILLFSIFFLSNAAIRADESPRKALGNPRVQSAALQLARDSLSYFFRTGKVLPTPAALPETLQKRGAVIVTIEKKNRVAPRGCRGTLQPRTKNLGEEIIHNAIAAATRDAREKPLLQGELKNCRISLTIILEMRPIQSLSQHDVENCGLIAQRGERIGLVLPYEGKDAATQWKWARAKAGLQENEKAQMLEVEAVRFREK